MSTYTAGLEGLGACGHTMDTSHYCCPNTIIRLLNEAGAGVEHDDGALGVVERVGIRGQVREPGLRRLMDSQVSPICC